MTADTVAAARAALGPVGAALPNFGMKQWPSIHADRAAVGRLEAAGYAAAWTKEGVGGRDAFVQSALLLATSDRIVLGTGIANIWAHAPEHMHAAASQLAEAYPGRFVLGIGVGYPFQAERVGRAYASPAATLRDYLERMPADDTMVLAPEAPYARVIAANGPKMLALARDGADGAIPTMVPPAFVRNAREVLGPDKLLIVGMTVVMNPDPAQAKATARTIATGALGFPGSPYRASLARLGYTDEELDAGGDRLLDDVVGYGDAARIAAATQAHLDAGADHVILITVAPDFGQGIAQLEEMAPAVTRTRAVV